MSLAGIPPSTLKFLRDLSVNNNREWFKANKPRYQTEHEHMIAFANRLLTEMQKLDELVPMSGKQSLFRIYRDIRFSKDKSPYKRHFSGRLKRATKWKRGGYYYHIEPGASFVAGGFWGPNSADLKRIRQEIAADPDSMRRLVADRTFKRTFGQLRGDQLKTSPQGYSRDHPAIGLLRYKHFLLIREFADEEVMDDRFLKELVRTYQRMRPFFDYMSEVLTTDANGVPIE